MRSASPTWLFRICVLGLVLISAAVLVWFPHSIVDDAYIYGRYADNLAQHGQLTWNLGEDPVEGYTGILLPLIYAFLFLCGLSLESAALAIAVFCYPATGLVLLTHARSKPSPVLIATTLLYCSMPFLYRHAHSGMETSLFTLLLMLAASMLLAILHGRQATNPLLFLLFLLLSLSRPEGIIFGSFFSILAILVSVRSKKSTWLHATGSAFVWFLLPYGAYFLWRLSFYGYLFPNTFYLKSAGEWVPASIRELGNFFFHSTFSIPLLLLAAVSLIINFTARLRAGFLLFSTKIKEMILSICIFGLPIGITLFMYARTNLSMNYSSRFFAPFYPLLLLLLAGSFPSSLQIIGNKKWLQPILGTIILACGFLPLVGFIPALKAEYVDASRSWALMQAEHITIGKKLARVIPADEGLVVIQDAGAIPYYSGLRTIDLGGLNDETIAHEKLTLEELNDYIFSADPGVFVITSYSPNAVKRTLGGGSQQFIDALLKDARFEEYTLTEVFSPSAPGIQYYEFVFVHERLVPLYPQSDP